MNMLLGVFEKYAVKHGDRLQLSNREMGNLFRGELHDLMKEVLTSLSLSRWDF